VATLKHAKKIKNAEDVTRVSFVEEFLLNKSPTKLGLFLERDLAIEATDKSVFKNEKQSG